MGLANLEKARGFDRVRHLQQTFRYADLAATKFKQMKDRPVELIDDALVYKYQALKFMAKHTDALECAKEWYCMYTTSHTYPPAINASFAVIESCIFNEEWFDAALYARTLWETITMSRDSTSQTTYGRSSLHVEHLRLREPCRVWHSMEACQQKSRRKQGWRRLCLHEARWKSTLSCMGSRV